VNENARAALERAHARLDRLSLYPSPVRTARVRIHAVPWFFRLPRFRRFDGFAAYRLILLRDEPGTGTASDDLITHELCHVWQMQHHPLKMPLSYLWTGYRRSPWEAEARRAAELTRQPLPARSG
jgi:hypothetical protein